MRLPIEEVEFDKGNVDILPVFGVDTLAHFDILIDPKRKCLVTWQPLEVSVAMGIDEV